MNVSFVFFIFIFFSTLVFGSIVDIAKHAAIAVVNSYGGPVGISVLVVYHLAIKHSNVFISKNKANGHNIYHHPKDLTEERLVPSPTCPIIPTESQPLPEGNTLFDQTLAFHAATLMLSITTSVSLAITLRGFRMASRANKRSAEIMVFEDKLQTQIEDLGKLIDDQNELNENFNDRLTTISSGLQSQEATNRRSQLLLKGTQKMLEISIDIQPDQNDFWIRRLKEIRAELAALPEQ